MDAFKVATFDGQVAGLGGAGAKHNGVKFAQEVRGRIILADLGVGEEGNPFGAI
jgi:hypothetical protein